MINLAKIRNEKGMNQLNLGMKINVDQVSISHYENGKSFPTVSNLLKLCELFHVSSDFLLDKTDVRTPVNLLATENFSNDELELLALYRNLPRNKKERAIGMLVGLSDS
ncbi:MAG: helix-turn-helix transcriptional regulator [Bacillota bacterium]